MLVIRLRRTGKKKKPSYRIVTADQRAPIYGKYIEMIGHYNPFTKVVVLNKEKALEWMDKGAKPTNTVAKLFQKESLKHKSIVVKIFRAISKKELEEQKAKEEAEKEKLQAEKEAQKAAFEQKVEAEKAAQPSSEEKLQQAAEESIEEIKEETLKTEEKVEEKPTEEEKSEEKTQEKPEASQEMQPAKDEKEEK